MSLRIRTQYLPGAALGYSIERISDGYLYDHSDGTFKATPVTPVTSIPELEAPRIGIYAVTIASTPTNQFTDGHYAVAIHDMSLTSQKVINVLVARMIDGDDDTIPTGEGGSIDAGDVAEAVWNYATATSETVGSFGVLVKTNLDTAVSEVSGADLSGIPAAVWDYATASANASGSMGRLISLNLDMAVSDIDLGDVDTSGIPKAVWEFMTNATAVEGSFGAVIKTNLDASVSSRSTYSGGAVASVTAPVTVGTNQDKTGYALDADGLDQIVIETGVNARQALVPILAATSGVVISDGTGGFVIKGGNSAVTRIQATTDSTGNRSSVILTLPN